MTETRLILFADILGFGNFVLQRPAEHVRQVLSHLASAAGAQSLDKRGFASLCFSDSIIIWQNEDGPPTTERLEELINIGSSMFVSALANRFPLRGAIAHGEFYAEYVDTAHPVFFGRGLVEAYRAEGSRDWIGIGVTQTAARIMSTSKVDEGARMLAWQRTSDQQLLLNPFLYLARVHGESEAGIRTRLMRQETMLAIELHALRFLLDTIRSESVDDQAKRKYAATIDFLERLWGSAHTEVLRRACSSLPDSSRWIDASFGVADPSDRPPSN
ncbi:MAG: hypothetical protein GY711_07125 [bacterium]|nr:hypothetical protein [bacterium]